MAKGLSTATIVGNLGHDPEIQETSNNTQVAHFSVAVNRSRQGQDETMWVRCTAWAKLADIAGQYLHKGNPVCVVGNIWLDEYTGRDGAARSRLELTVRELVLLGSRSGQEPDSAPVPAPAPTPAAPAPSPQPIKGPDDHDLPF